MIMKKIPVKYKETATTKYVVPQKRNPIFEAFRKGHYEHCKALIKDIRDRSFQDVKTVIDIGDVEFLRFYLNIRKASHNFYHAFFDLQFLIETPKAMQPILCEALSVKDRFPQLLVELTKLKSIPDQDLVKVLLEAGIDAVNTDHDGNSALLNCVSRNNLDDDIFELLVSKSSVNNADNEGYSPLIIACMSGRGERVKTHVNVLLRAGADVTMKDVRGNTAFDHVVSREMSFQESDLAEIIAMLLNNGHKPKLSDGRIFYNRKQIFELLSFDALKELMLTFEHNVRLKNQLLPEMVKQIWSQKPEIAGNSDYTNILREVETLNKDVMIELLQLLPEGEAAARELMTRK